MNTLSDGIPLMWKYKWTNKTSLWP